MKKILFPFEIGNPIYRDAYVYAVKLARNLYREVILLNTFKIEEVEDITEATYHKLIRENWFRAYNDINRFNQYYLEAHARIDDELKIKFDHRFIHGLFKDEIRKTASEEEVGIIVLPISDKKETNRRQLEIIRDNLFERNRVSLFIIPFQESFKPIKNIVFSIDLRKVKKFGNYLDEVVHFARAFDANIHFIHVCPRERSEIREDSKELQMVMKVIENDRRHSFQQIFGKDVVKSVNQYVVDNKADLLAVVKHQHYFLDTLFHKSFSNEISFNSRVPVLIMREERD